MTVFGLILAACSGYSIGALAVRLGAHGPRHGDGQDSRFAFRRGRFVDRASGEAIPHEEPIVILRASDRNALPALGYYYGLAQDVHREDGIRGQIEAFHAYSALYGLKAIDGGARFECLSCHNRSRTPDGIEHERWCDKA